MHFKDKRVLQIKTVDDMLTILKEKGNPLSSYKKGTRITVYYKNGTSYSFVLSENPNENFHPEFKPVFTFSELLEHGVMEGKYSSLFILALPKEWFLPAIKKGKLRPEGADPKVNYFGVKSRSSLKEWQQKGWVPNPYGVVSKQYPILSNPNTNPDIFGWLGWYGFYSIGRRIPELDEVQIKRWKAFRRHAGQIKANCRKGDLSCRPIQRQALLQWAHDPFI